MNKQGEIDMFIFALSDVYAQKMTCKIDLCWNLFYYTYTL